MQTYKYPIATRRLHTISLFLIAALFIITIVVTIKFSSTTIIEAINPTKKEEIHFIVSKKIPETLSIDDTNCPDGTLPNPLWQKAYRNPRFCNDTYEHGIFNLNTLQKSLSIKNIACGSYCIFLPSKNIFPPTSSLGWALKQQSKDDDSPAAATACWSEIGYFDDCMENWKEYQKRVERTGGTDMISTAELLHLSLPPQSEKEEQQHSLAFECDPIITGQEGGERMCGPHILIIGAMKCGTNSIGKYLQLHPDIVLKQGTQQDYDESVYELNYFTHMTLLQKKDPLSLDARRSYTRLLPSPLDMSSNSKATFDKSPSYLDSQWWGGRVASIAKKLLPHAKIVVSVCNPTERMYSHFRHIISTGLMGELKGIDNFDVLVDEILKDPVSANVNFTAFDIQKTLTGVFYETGLYSTHILDWMREYGRENVLIVSLDSIAQDSYAVAKSIIDFVGLDWSKYPEKNAVESLGKVFANAANNYSRNHVPVNARRKLDMAYERSIRLLADMMNDDHYLKWIPTS